MLRQRPRSSSPRRLLAWAIAAALALPVLSPPAHAEPQWKDATVVPAGGTVEGAVSSASDAAGNAVAAWATPAAIMVSRRPAGGVWGAAEVLAATPERAEAPQVHVNPDGRTVVAWAYPWEGGNKTNGGVWVRTTTPGQPWGPVLNGAPGSDRGRLVTDMAPDGTLHALWQGGLAASSISLSQAGQWSDMTFHAIPGCSLGAPTSLTAEANGTVTALTTGWKPAIVDNSVTPPVVTERQWWCTYVERWSPGGGWGSLEVLDPDSTGHAHVTSAPDGSAHAAWVSTRGLLYAERTAQGVWGQEQVLQSSASATGQAGIQVAVDAYGGISVVWAEGGPSSRTIRARTRLPGSTWGPIVNLSAPHSATSYATLATDPLGQLHATWTRVTPDGPVIESATRDGETTWNAVVPLGTGALPTQTVPLDDLRPSAASDGTGNVLFAWPRHEGGVASSVQLRTLDGAGPRFTSTSVPVRVAAGAVMGYTAEASDAWSGFSSMAWDFGDGATATGTSVSHSYAAEGSFTVTLTAVDGVGNVSRTTRLVRVTPAATSGTSALTKFTLSRKRLRIKGPAKKRKVKAVLMLDGPATVTLTWKKRVVTKTKKGKKRALKTVARTRLALKAGANSVTLTSKVGTKRLKPGKYVLVAATTNSKRAKLRITR